MKVDVNRLSVQEIHQRFIVEEKPVSSYLLRRLQRDSRRGVRKIYQRLKKRRDALKTAEVRIDALLNFERVLWKAGVERIAGVDEAGVGPLAGPVIAAAVVFRPGTEIQGIDDSKKLDPSSREEAAQAIRAHAEVAIGQANIEEIDRLNIYHASLLAMRRAVKSLPLPPEHVLVDARKIPGLPVPQNTFNKGDGLNYSIAAASIIAKTYRDQLMVDLDHQFPEYGFARHKGYCTRAHQRAIRHFGPCSAHRSSFRFIQELCGEYSKVFYRLKAAVAGACSASDLNRVEEEIDASRTQLSGDELKKLNLVLARRWENL